MWAKDEFSVNVTGILGKKCKCSNRDRTYDLTTSDALPLSCRRLVVATILDKTFETIVHIDVKLSLPIFKQ